MVVVCKCVAKSIMCKWMWTENQNCIIWKIRTEFGFFSEEEEAKMFSKLFEGIGVTFKHCFYHVSGQDQCLACWTRQNSLRCPHQPKQSFLFSFRPFGNLLGTGGVVKTIFPEQEIFQILPVWKWIFARRWNLRLLYFWTISQKCRRWFLKVARIGWVDNIEISMW